jgi:hypothetical protein
MRSRPMLHNGRILDSLLPLEKQPLSVNEVAASPPNRRAVSSASSSLLHQTMLFWVFDVGVVCVLHLPVLERKDDLVCKVSNGISNVLDGVFLVLCACHRCGHRSRNGISRCQQQPFLISLVQNSGTKFVRESNRLHPEEAQWRWDCYPMASPRCRHTSHSIQLTRIAEPSAAPSPTSIREHLSIFSLVMPCCSAAPSMMLQVLGASHTLDGLTLERAAACRWYNKAWLTPHETIR